MLTRAARIWRANNKERLRKIFKRHYRKCRERILKRNKEWRLKNEAHLRQYRKKNAARISAAGRKHEYGLSNSQFLEMLKNQKNRCPICERKLIKPYVDHDHKTEIVRGILCRDCNLLLGHAKDSIKFLRNAILYLRTSNA